MSMFEVVVFLVGSLDSLPNPGRLLLSGALLALLLGFINGRIEPVNAALGVSYRKSALLALLIIPVLIHFVIGVRLVVLVAELPAVDPAPGYVWWAGLAAWALGAGYFALRSVNRLRHEALIVRAEGIDGLQEPGEKLSLRFAHWRSRLSMPRGIGLVLGNVSKPCSAGWLSPQIVLPRAAAHWPVAAQDLLLTLELCRLKRKTRVWAVAGELVAALYWPIPWVRAIAAGLNRSLVQTSSQLAMSCFSDRLGYERASKQLTQRLEVSAEALGLPEWERTDISVGARYKYRLKSQRKDPHYDRVFWALIQVTVVVFVLTGTTLRQLEPFDPEEVELAERWYFSYERSADYSDRQVETTRRRGG